MSASPILLWVRRDLRLADNPVLHAAAATGRPVVPVFICDEQVAALGAAPRWRLELGVEAFARALAGIGSRLILRRGSALDILQELARETGAGSVWWGRQYDPASRDRDSQVKSALRANGIEARSFHGHLLFEPWEVQTGQGRFYQVYTPYWRAVSGRDVAAPLPAPVRIATPLEWPNSDALADWALGQGMQRGAGVVSGHLHVGEAAARDRLDAFIDRKVIAYARDRDRLDVDGTSGLSENLTYGEISPRILWHAGQRALVEGAAGAETFLKEIVWREFAWHLLFHAPHMAQENWRDGWQAFPWRGDSTQAEIWRRGQTGIDVIDAALRELYVTGRMHNRARMLVGSYLTKHMLTHWRVGLDWFAECLVDWDAAANAMGWQWVAGSGPDAAPYFRIFNPDTQADKFDPAGAYRRHWLRGDGAAAFGRAVPLSWKLDPFAPRPAPIVDLAVGRARALDAYATLRAEKA